MTFIPHKAIKSQALVDFLATHPVLETLKLHKDVPGEVIEANMTSKDEVWQMFFNYASRMGPKGMTIAGVGVVFVSPHNHVLPRSFSLWNVVPIMWPSIMPYLLASNSLNR